MNPKTPETRMNPKDKARLNAEYRAYATQVAAFVARLLGVKAPRVTKITRNSGTAFSSRSEIYLPRWIFTEAHPIYRLYYIIHETAHMARGAAGWHGKEMRIAENSVMEMFGYRLMYADSNAARRPYPIGIVDLKTGWQMTGKVGEPI
jgi:hypothetical protein